MLGQPAVQGERHFPGAADPLRGTTGHPEQLKLAALQTGSVHLDGELRRGHPYVTKPASILHDAQHGQIGRRVLRADERAVALEERPPRAVRLRERRARIAHEKVMRQLPTGRLSGRDPEVRDRARQAQAVVRCETRLLCPVGRPDGGSQCRLELPQGDHAAWCRSAQCGEVSRRQLARREGKALILPRLLSPFRWLSPDQRPGVVKLPAVVNGTEQCPAYASVPSAASCFPNSARSVVPLSTALLSQRAAFPRVRHARFCLSAWWLE